ncbi:MAG TPA: beta-N-acetylhexosaminidase [Micromonosporaceae bacterium]|nr:beta-N-acetylhexosaminidase [Micromonosporaceae bacterium]
MLPYPASVTVHDGTFVLTESTVLVAEAGCAGVGHWLRSTLPLLITVIREFPGRVAGVASAEVPDHGDQEILLGLDPALPAEGYRLHVRPDRIDILGGGPAGVFYGAQTLRQLLPPAIYRKATVHTGQWTIPCVEIEDAPRFGWRGCMLDVARHFMPKSDLLRFIDLLALHKLNVLHLHLTDDQGWRLQIRRYPLLTEVGAWRHDSMVGSRQHEQFNGRPHGGFYTQEDIREIVGYAAERFITVVPEIDIPGHTQAAIAAYPFLGNGVEPTEVSPRWGISRQVLNVSDQTITFFHNVFDEVLELFPSHHIGIGGDECRKDEWRASAAVQERLRDLGLRDEDELQSWFVQQFHRYLDAKGRRLYGWDEILEGGLPLTATVAAWRGPTVALAAAEAGHDVVVCPDTSVYLDYRQSDGPEEPIPVGTLLTVDDVRRFDPPSHERVIGAQCNVWTEHADSTRAVDYLAFPRLCAFAEVAWSTQPSDVDTFPHRLREHLPRLDALGVEYRPDSGPHPWQRRPDAAGWPRQHADREIELAALTRNVLGRA